MEIVKLARRSKKPVLITLQGKPGVVVLDAAVYENRLKTANLISLLEEGEQDIRAGRLCPAVRSERSPSCQKSIALRSRRSTRELCEIRDFIANDKPLAAHRWIHASRNRFCVCKQCRCGMR